MANKNTTATANETNNEKKVIILNKPFLGGWLDEEGRIGHEIIDFFLADNDRYYVYNNPRGACPDEIYAVEDTIKNKTKKYLATYMVLTSAAHAQNGNDDNESGEDEGGDGKQPKKQSDPKIFNILYVIKLKHKIHSKHTGKDLKDNQAAIKTDEQVKDISYNGASLYNIYPEDETLYLTFEADKDGVYKVKDDKIWTFEPKSYNFQRNKGYLKNDGNTVDDYNKLVSRIDKEIGEANNQEKSSNCLLQKINLITFEDITQLQKNDKYNTKKTFLDLIGFTNEEQAFTNMLYFLLNNNYVFKKFCQYACKQLGIGCEEFDEEKGLFFKISREKKVLGGRMDISGESESKRVIIENKIHSGLNGIKRINKEKTISQLSTYYNEWGLIKDEKSPNPTIKPLCFITAPDFRKQELMAEIAEFDTEMEGKYHIITYSMIAKFFEQTEIKKRFEEENALIHSLYNQIVNAFKNWSYKDKQDLYASMFWAATEEANKRKLENK